MQYAHLRSVAYNAESGMSVLCPMWSIVGRSSVVVTCGHVGFFLCFVCNSFVKGLLYVPIFNDGK